MSPYRPHPTTPRPPPPSRPTDQAYGAAAERFNAERELGAEVVRILLAKILPDRSAGDRTFPGTQIGHITDVARRLGLLGGEVAK